MCCHEKVCCVFQNSLTNVKETVEKRAGQGCPQSQTHREDLQSMTCSITLSSHSSFTCAQCEPTLISEENWVQMASLNRSLSCWTRVPLKDAGPSNHPHGLSLCKFGEKRIQRVAGSLSPSVPSHTKE